MIVAKKNVKRAIFGLVISMIIVAGMLVQFPGSRLHAADDCLMACDRYLACAPEIMKKKPTADQRNTLQKGCMNSCKNPKLTKGIVACYTKNKDQCTVFFQCLVSAGQKM